jgi:dTDP-4-amino-4,6-dideoxygalactose transaminase/acetyltransferase-like isoleucine patch superfamily enzyme
MMALGLTFVSAISPLAHISPSARIGQGITVFPHVVVNTGAHLDNYCILNVDATVSHDTKVGRYSNINPGVHLAGNVTVGEGCYIGMGANVIQGRSIGSWTVVGAGAVVTQDLPGNVTAVGVPAAVIKKGRDDMNDESAPLKTRFGFDSKVNIVRPVLPDFADLAEGMRNILSSGMVTKGQYLRAFEEAVAAHLGVKHAIAVSSCTTGLMLTYHSLGLVGDVVIPSFTFMATASALIWAGLCPVFADVDVDTTNLDPAAAEAAITPDTSAIIAVHNFGNPADIDALQTITDRHGLKLILDAAHGFGALYQGVPVGPQGDAQVFSLSPTKLLIAGEGGIVATNDDELAKKMCIGREYGNSGDYDSAFAGLNARMSEFHALLGLHSLRGLEDAARHRNRVASLYCRELGRLPGIGFQKVQPGNRSSYKDFSITVDPDAFGLTRDELTLSLAAENVDTRNYYDPPVHRQTAYRQFVSPTGTLSNTDWLAAHSFSLPIWSHMDEAIALGICQAIQRIHESAKEMTMTLDQAAIAFAT